MERGGGGGGARVGLESEGSGGMLPQENFRNFGLP